MRTQTIDPKDVTIEGEELLKKAILNEKESRRLYGQYIQWVQKHQIHLNVIVSQFIKIKGWSLTTSRKYAKGIISLTEPDNSSHLEALLNGEISFEVACMRVTELISKKVVYNDEETATRYLQRAFTIMRHRNKAWKHTEILAWVKNILDKFIANKT